MFILDTNILIYFFKGLGNVSQNLLAISPKQIGIHAIVVYELEVGIRKSNSSQKRMKQLKDLLSVVNTLAFGNAEAVAAAQIRAQL
jgi:tRNA(fMet)-specific endonuclease VapC